MPRSPAVTPLPDEAFAALRGALGLSVGHTSAPMADSVALAQAADRAGLDLVSIGDVPSETFTMLGAIAATTDRIGLMSGIAQWSRTPVTMAFSAKTLQNLAGGRYTLGIGPMPQPWAEDHHGLAWQPAGQRMRDYVGALRAALAATPEQPTAHEGPFFRSVGFEGAPMTPDRPVAVHLAASRPRMTQLAAEVADGVMFNAIQPVPWLETQGAEALAAGLATAGRPRDRFSVGLYRFFGIADDRAEAYDHARRCIAFYFGIPYFRPLLEPYGFGDELDAGEAALAAGDHEGQLAAVSDRLVDAIALAGTPDEVRAKLARTRELADYVIAAGTLAQSGADAFTQTSRMIAALAPLARRGRAAAPAPAPTAPAASPALRTEDLPA